MSEFPESPRAPQSEFRRDNRRGVVQYFREQSRDAASVEELATFVQEHHRPDADAYRVAIDLHHVTLPKLADGGFVDYDARRRTARYRSDPPEHR